VFISDVPTWKLFTVDLLLVAMFMVQHSGMLSTFYLNFINDWGLIPISRTIYVLMSAVSLLVSIFEW